MRRKLFVLVLVLAMLALPLAADLRAQEAPVSPQTVKVGLYLSPPFVMEENGRYTGMAIELWETIASDLDLRSEYEVLPTIRELVEATSAGDLDVAVTNLTITQSRAERIDFTHPWYDAGLRIMINEDRGTGFWDVVTGLRESGHLRAYAWLAFVIVAATVLMTLFDRRFDKDFPQRWRDGISESFFSVMSIATSGRAARRNLFGWVGRIWQALWLVCGVAVLAYITSTVTSVMTTLSHQPDQQPRRPSRQDSRRVHRQRRGGIRPRCRTAPAIVRQHRRSHERHAGRRHRRDHW